MLARFVGGVHDGLELDGEAIRRYCLVRRYSTSKGIQTFVLMPPTQEDWDQLLAGEVGKDEIPGPWIPYLQVGIAASIGFHCDEGGHRYAEAERNAAAGRGRLVEIDLSADVSGTYYKCLRGDNDSLGLTEPDSFVVHDATGRDWICYPVSEEDAALLNLHDHVADVAAADASLRKLGMLNRGTEVRVYFCQDDAELRDRLAEESS
jgi:hypothetical protein